MFAPLLILHSWLRWLILLAALNAVGRAIGGNQSGRPWGPGDDQAGKWLVILFDIQFLIGLILYVALSPTTEAAFADFGAAMRDSQLRFFAVEHIVGMLAASALLHIGRTKTQKAAPASRHKIALIFFGLALFLVLVSIPWPFSPAPRGLFRFS
jgi:hypothetical protein